MGTAGVAEQTAPLTTKAIPNGNVVKLVDNFFDGLTGDDELLGKRQGFSNRYDLNWPAVFRYPGGHGAVHSRSAIEQG